MPANESSEDKPQPNFVAERISQLLQDGVLAALATLIDPSTTAVKVGTKLLVEKSTAKEAVIGSLGDGVLDLAVIEQAARFLESRAETLVFHVKEFAPSLTEWSDVQILFERVQQEPRLVICGAGHVGASLARLSALIGYHVTLIDDRAEFVRRELFPDERIALIATGSWFEAVRDAVGDGRGVSVAVVTRGHSEDEQCMRAVIGTGADYLGLIGSKRRTNIVLQRLRENGAEEIELENARAPVGLDIGAVTAGGVASRTIMAEIVGLCVVAGQWRHRFQHGDAVLLR
jgi:xanthine dehydrogenase accessory factor